MFLKRIILFYGCAMILGILFCGCTNENRFNTSSSSVPVGTETDPQITLPSLSPDKIVSSFKSTPPLLISSGCRQVTLSDQDTAAVLKAFTERGYTSVNSSSASDTKLKTVVLQNDSWTVTITETSNGSVHIIWERANIFSTAPLAKPENTQSGDVTMAQIGIARGNEDDNPMIGMCYLYRLGDGSAVILDGGVSNAKCADNLFEALKKLNISKTESGKYRISAWIFSHGHSDHIGTFETFTSRYAGQYDICAVMYSFPSVNTGLSCDTVSFEQAVTKYCPNALRISPHAGLRYYFGNLTVHILYHPELLYTGKSGVKYFNDTSLIMKFEANGQTVLHLGDAGEQAASAALKENSASAFESDILQITHHGLYTGPDSHSWNALKKIYNNSSASYGLLPMGTRNPDDTRDGRYTVLIAWGVGQSYQVSYILNPKNNCGFSDLSQSDFKKFTADAENGTAKFDTLYGFNGINIAVNSQGMITYLSASENDLMATEFLLSETGTTVTANGSLSDWLTN